MDNDFFDKITNPLGNDALFNPTSMVYEFYNDDDDELEEDFEQEDFELEDEDVYNDDY